jgi:L-cystine transport system permease protein
MYFDINYAIETVGEIISKLPLTLYMALSATTISLILGIIFSFITRRKIKGLSQSVTVLMSFFKGIPVLVLLFISYYTMPSIMVGLSESWGLAYDIRNPPALSFAIVAFALSYSAYMKDMIDTALDTVPKGQMEACKSIGYTNFQSMYRIIGPQAVVVAIPNFGNHFINLFKLTSLAYMVGVMEILGTARNIGTVSLKFLEPYAVACLIYWIVCIIFENIFSVIEKKLGIFRNK